MQEPQKRAQPALADKPEADQQGQSLELESERLPNEEYTVICCNKPQSTPQIKVVIFLIFLTSGAFIRYQEAFYLELQEKGATYNDQANLIITSYPYWFKIFLAPLIDMFFFEKVGRCRTWIVSSCVLIAAALMVTAPFADRLMHPDNMTAIITLWFCLNILAVFFLIAGEMWVVKALDGADKGVGSLIFDIGFSLGTFISYNLFVPLSSLKWLNENIFKSRPLSRPLMVPSEMMVFIAAIHLVFGLWIFLRVAEKKTEHLHERMSFKRLFKMIPQLFVNKHLRTVLFVIALQRFFRNLVNESIGLKFVDNNMSKATIANTDTYSFPFIFLAGHFLNKLMLKGGLMRKSSWMALYGLACMVMRFSVLQDFIERQDQERAFWLYLTVSVFERGFFETALPLGFVNMITPDAVGSTFITLFTSWSNLTQTLPSTIGLRLVGAELLDYNKLVWLVIILAVFSILYSFVLGRELDSTPLEEYHSLTIGSTSRKKNRTTQSSW